MAFSCKGRGLCPSCGAKRAADTANRLREDALEPVGHAQWVFTVPKMLARLVVSVHGGPCVRAWVSRWPRLSAIKVRISIFCWIVHPAGFPMCPGSSKIA